MDVQNFFHVLRLTTVYTVKKLEQEEKLKEQKKLAKDQKNKPKTTVQKLVLTKFMEEHGITPTSSPEHFSKVLELACKYHAKRF